MEVKYLKELAHKSDFDDLVQLRNLAMYILSFAGFLRSSEICQLRSHDITFNGGYISILIQESKTDQLRDGQSVVIAESNTDICPVKLLKLYMHNAKIQQNSSEFLFRPITSSQ